MDVLRKTEIKEMCSGIEDIEIRNNVIEYLTMEVNDDFWIIPAARGKHHPLDERGDTGLILHTKRVKEMVIWLGMAEQLPQYEMDLLLAAAIVHDTKKPGYEHPDLIKDTNLLLEVINIAKMHMGPWYKKERWPNVCKLGRMLYYADYIVSRENFILLPEDMIIK